MSYSDVALRPPAIRARKLSDNEVVDDEYVDRLTIAFRITLLVLLLALLILLVLLLWRRGSSGTGSMSSPMSSTGESGAESETSGSAASDGRDGQSEQSKSDVSPGAESPKDANDHATINDAESLPDTSESGSSEVQTQQPDEQTAERPVPTTALLKRIEPVTREGNAGPTGGRGGPGTPREAGDFFGLKLKGSKVVYVVDRSSSMAGPRFDGARAELTASIQSLRKSNKFFVFFFSDGTDSMGALRTLPSRLATASSQNVAACVRWVQRASASGGTFPLDAMQQAIKLKPDVIFLLTDGDFYPSIVDEIRKVNNGRVVINTVAFIDESGGPLLKRIAKENRGEYRFVP